MGEGNDVVGYAGAQWTPSPNYWSGRAGLAATHIVMHGTAGSAEASIAWLTTPQSVASVHYLVDRGGFVYQLVCEEDSAWGNGIPEEGSPFLGGENPNLWTISIEHERRDPANETPITAEQQAASIALVRDIRQRRGVLPLIPHSLISPLSRARCPGLGFPLDVVDQASRVDPVVVAPRRPAAPAPVRYEVLVDMMARMGPAVWKVGVPVQMCYRGASLEGTGRARAGWVEVVAGGRHVWLLGRNLRKVA